MDPKNSNNSNSLNIDKMPVYINPGKILILNKSDWYWNIREEYKIKKKFVFCNKC